MKKNPKLIVMLTYNDHTVENAFEIFEQCKNSKAEYWGFKEEPMPLEQMKKLYTIMKKCGKKTVLEVVAYSEEKCMAGAKIASECNCDMLMGTMFFDSVNEFCKKNNIKYMPFVGKVSGRPSILEGSEEMIIEQAKACIQKGAYGIDLLGYRFTGNASQLNVNLTNAINSPVCIAGSVNSYERLDELKDTNASFFTIGSAFFDNKFDGDFCEQIDKVCDYMQK